MKAPSLTVRLVLLECSLAAAILVALAIAAFWLPARAPITALAIGAAPVLLLVLLVSRSLARRALAPLSRMAEQAERTALRGAPHPLGRDSDPAEIAALAGSLNRLISRLEEGLRVEREFAHDVAHELRAPVTALSGELELAMADPPGSERQKESLRRVADQVRQMSGLVDALLLLRRVDTDLDPERNEMRALDLGDLVQGVARELVARFPERAGDLRVEADGRAPVTGHETLIQSAIRNLLANALQLTRPGQRVLVTVPEGLGRCVVMVEDGGRGAAAEPGPPGPEARAVHDGFGLPILRRVTRVHGGDLAVASSGLGGARFELWFPPIETPR